MDYRYLSSRIKALQRELEKIQNHNRKYFARNHHTEIEKIEHRNIQVRASEIRAELSNLLRSKTA